MMPMVFCASLPPWPSEYSDAETNCRMRKARSTANGVERTDAQDTIATSTSASRNPTSGDSTMASKRLRQPAPDRGRKSGLGHAAADQSADQGVRTGGRNAQSPGDQVPDDGADQGGEYHLRIDDAGFDDAGADGVRDVEPEHQEGDEIEERRPQHRILRPQHPGRDDGRDRVGGVVQSVEEVEQQRDCDQSDQNRKTKRGVHCAALPYTCSITMLLISFATSSKRSATFSRWS